MAATNYRPQVAYMANYRPLSTIDDLFLVPAAVAGPLAALLWTQLWAEYGAANPLTASAFAAWGAFFAVGYALLGHAQERPAGPSGLMAPIVAWVPFGVACALHTLAVGLAPFALCGILSATLFVGVRVSGAARPNA